MAGKLSSFCAPSNGPEAPAAAGGRHGAGPAPRAAAEEPGRWSADRAHRWYQAHGWLVGANYITSNAINQLEMFQPGTYDPRRIDNELGLARFHGFNTVRVFLHDLLWAQDAPGFQTRLAQFVAIAARYHIKPLFVCSTPAGTRSPDRVGSGRQGLGCTTPGGCKVRVLNASMTAAMPARCTTTSRVCWANSATTIACWVGTCGMNPTIPRACIARWKGKTSSSASRSSSQVFRWARTVDPVQPLTSGVWQGNWGDPGRRSTISAIQLDNADVITFHSYAAPAEFEGRIAELAPLQRPILCTEYLARSQGSTVEGILPIAKRHNVGAFNWGLVAGKTQTYLPWDSWDHPYRAPPKVWFHDLLHPNGRPYRDGEVQTIRKLNGMPSQD